MIPGPLLFARYAYPPNALGYCGPGDAGALLEQASQCGIQEGGVAPSPLSRDADRDISQRARQFEGAWPYLQLIAAENHIADPLDERVVEAYWVGNSLLERVSAGSLAVSLDTRFRRQAGRSWDHMAGILPLTVHPHHSFHVFAVYPWVGLMRAGRSDEPLRVLDQCRIRWGRVEEIRGDMALVRSRPLAWDGTRLDYGPSRLETAVLSKNGTSLVNGLRPGDWVSLHWDWLCDRLTERQVKALERYSASSITAVNSSAHPAPAAVLG